MKQALTALICLAFPGAALACALPPSVILTLPTGLYTTGAAAAVGLTALLGATRMPALTGHEWARIRDPLPSVVTSYISFLALALLIPIGFLGASDPMHNLLTLVFWVGVWVVVPLVSMVFGNVWARLNPWTGPVRIARALLGLQGDVGLSRLGHAPAVAGLLAFSWFQIASLKPEDPQTLALAALIYWAVIFALAVAEGEDWLDRGEFLTVYFAMIARIAPLWAERADRRLRLMAGWPGAQILALPPMGRGQAAFVTLALAALTFDGLSETFWWLALVGENPLEFTGRSAVIWENTAGLLAAWALTAGVIAATLRLGGGRISAGPVMLSFLAIAAGYHAAHYLTTLLTSGQYLLSALNDPLFRGDDLLGLPLAYVSFGFLTDPTRVRLIYGVEFAAILGAHLLAVVLVTRLADGLRGFAHWPLTGLMVGYTVLGLWLMSTARGV